MQVRNLVCLGLLKEIARRMSLLGLSRCTRLLGLVGMLREIGTVFCLGFFGLCRLSFEGEVGLFGI